MATNEDPQWREREKGFGVQDTGPIPVKTTGQLPLPSEGVRFVEPAWNLHGLIRDPECEAKFEQRMIEAEEEKVFLQEQEFLNQQTVDDTKKEEIRLRKLEEQQMEEALAAQEKAERAEANRAFAEEIERAVRELRTEANEQYLRAAEAQISTMHSRAIRREKVIQEEEEQAEQMYMQSVEEQMEKQLEKEEEQRFDRLLDRLDADQRLQIMTHEGEEEEKEHVERQDRRSRMQQEQHVVSDITEEQELERIARKSEEEAREREELDDSDGHADSKIVLQMLLDEAKSKHESFKGELRERHLAFVETLRKKAVDMHMEAEEKRKQEWAAGDKTFAESHEILHRARMLVDNMDQHVKHLNDEYRFIAERQDLWPMQKGRKPHSANAVDDAARVRREHDPFRGDGSVGGQPAVKPARPMTSTSQMKAEAERDAAIAAGKTRAPTGFAHAIRIVFEHMDRKREGRLKEGDVAEGLRLLGLDDTVSLAGLFGGVAGVDGIGFDEFQDMVMGVLGRQHSPTRTPPPAASEARS